MSFTFFIPGLNGQDCGPTSVSACSGRFSTPAAGKDEGQVSPAEKDQQSLADSPGSTDSGALETVFSKARAVKRFENGLGDSGISFGWWVKTAVTKELRGGISTAGVAPRELLEVNATINSDQLLGWHGGKIFASYHDFRGTNASRVLAGDAQVFSNIDDIPGGRLYEFWYEQTWLGGKLRLKAGRVDANSEFDISQNGAEFLNSSMGYSPTIMSFPSYPHPRSSVNFFVAPNSHFNTAFGVYRVHGGSMPIAEFGMKWANSTYPGRLALGTWHIFATMTSVEGGPRNRASGLYLAWDQTLWRARRHAGNSQGLGAFFQYGQADPVLSSFQQHLGGGLQWTGMAPGRAKDVLGLGATRVQFSDLDRDFDEHSEIALELFYKFQLNRWLSVKPDFQYIHNPGGVASRCHPVLATLYLMIAP